MHYLALGDSISIDHYTSVPGGGAASQLARLLGATRFHDLTRDGHLAEEVLQDLDRVDGRPDVVTVTAGGNNLIVGDPAEVILEHIRQIAAGLVRLGPPRVVLNTVYDPTDGDDRLGQEHGIPLELRERFHRTNAGIVEAAERHGFLLSDLEALFHGHGIASEDPWITMVIEPNHAGATAIARHWHALLRA